MTPSAGPGPVAARSRALLPADEVVAAADLVLSGGAGRHARQGLVLGLAETRAWRAGQIVVHTSGAHGLAVLAPAAACRAYSRWPCIR
ncbi:MAG: hypothetical protein WKF47_03780 [Geodermatophilaceae bacterium]